MPPSKVAKHCKVWEVQIEVILDLILGPNRDQSIIMETGKWFLTHKSPEK